MKKHYLVKCILLVTGCGSVIAQPPPYRGYTPPQYAVTQTFSGVGAPGLVPGNLPGDLYTDTATGISYVCAAPQTMMSPACTSVSSKQWALTSLCLSGTVLPVSGSIVGQCFIGTNPPGTPPSGMFIWYNGIWNYLLGSDGTSVQYHNANRVNINGALLTNSGFGVNVGPNPNGVAVAQSTSVNILDSSDRNSTSALVLSPRDANNDPKALIEVENVGSAADILSMFIGENYAGAGSTVGMQSIDLGFGITSGTHYVVGSVLPTGVTEPDGSVNTVGGFQQPLHTPASSSEPCTAGRWTDDANYHYVCTATNTWKRVALSGF